MNTNRKLRNWDIVKIRQLLNKGVSNKSISKHYNISPQLVCDIKKNRKYKDSMFYPSEEIIW